jgi:hypothetical protein
MRIVRGVALRRRSIRIYDWGPMGRLCSVLTVVILFGLVGATSATAALSNDGRVTVEYSGKLAQTYVANPSNPALQQGHLTFTWDETAIFALSGRAEHNETSRLVSWSLTVSGGHTETLAPPNQAVSCSATFSRRPGARNPISVFYSNHAVGVTATMPVAGTFVQSSASQFGSHCFVPPTGGLGYSAPENATLAYEHMLLAEATVHVPSNPYSRTLSADGAGTAMDGSHLTQSLSGVLQVSTSGRTSGPGNTRLTPAEVEAKRNALDALKETLPAALYPCLSLAAGATLLAPTPLGLAIGGTLVAVGGKLCSDYYGTILAEVDTVKDPPRSDFNLLAPAGASASAAAASPAARLLGAADATAAAARAISTTIAREVGARHVHASTAAGRQDRHLKALGIVFRRRRADELAAGRTLASRIRQSGSAPRLSGAQVSAAQSTFLGRLSARGLSSAKTSFAGRLLRPGPLDVLATLGR